MHTSTKHEQTSETTVQFLTHISRLSLHIPSVVQVNKSMSPQPITCIDQKSVSF